jgi:hypothetical protein
VAVAAAVATAPPVVLAAPITRTVALGPVAVRTTTIAIPGLRGVRARVSNGDRDAGAPNRDKGSHHPSYDCRT